MEIKKELHKEVLDRYSKLDIPPYRGFINPQYVPVYDTKGNISDVKLKYGENYTEQMLRLSQDYTTLGF